MAPEADSADLAAAVRHATSGSPELAAMRQRAAELVRQRFNVSRMAQEWADLLVGVRRSDLSQLQVRR